MRTYALSLLVAGAMALVGCSNATRTTEPTTTAQWGPVPAILPAGAQIAVLEGDLSKPEPFTLRLRFPDGYRIAPHTHPTDEHVTVLEGTFAVGMGTTFDASAMQSLGVGNYVTAPANHAHYAEAHGATIVQVHGMGPFALTYVNPADAPRASAMR